MCEVNSIQYLKELIAEKEKLDQEETPSVVQTLLNNEIYRIQHGGHPQGYTSRLLDVYNEKPVRVSAKVSIPTREHPKFNFVGKLLGPRGSSLKQLQENTMTKMAILGRGSMRDKQQEEELRNSCDPKHSHLKEDLHVEINAFATPAEAHARLAFALKEIRKYLIPDSNDQIRQHQMREIRNMKKLNGEERRDSAGNSESDKTSCNSLSPASDTSVTTINDTLQDINNHKINCHNNNNGNSRSILDLLQNDAEKSENKSSDMSKTNSVSHINNNSILDKIVSSQNMNRKRKIQELLDMNELYGKAQFNT